MISHKRQFFEMILRLVHNMSSAVAIVAGSRTQPLSFIVASLRSIHNIAITERHC